MKNEVGELKKRLREGMKETLKGMVEAERVVASEKARILLEAQELWKRADRILFFAPVGGELDVWPLFDDAIRAGKEVYLPRFVTGEEEDEEESEEGEKPLKRFQGKKGERDTSLKRGVNERGAGKSGAAGGRIPTGKRQDGDAVEHVPTGKRGDGDAAEGGPAGKREDGDAVERGPGGKGLEDGWYVACRIRDGEADVLPGRFGIREPIGECMELALNRLDFVLVPGIAFDLQGRRLGRGKGYYDRLLAEVRGKTCGVAFDEQIVEALPVEPHDVHVNCILTPTRWIEL